MKSIVDGIEPEIQGYVETLAERYVRGWACDRRVPDKALEIVVKLGDKRLATGSASILRPDLARAGLGRGEHEFDIGFDEWVHPTQLALVQVFAVIEGVEYALPPIQGAVLSRADAASDPATPLCDTDAEPVFILGPARSGTSALPFALLRTGVYEGHGEGHLLPLLHALLKNVDEYYADSRAAMSRDTMFRATHYAAFQRMIRRGFVQLTRAMYPNGRWIDKTPTASMVQAAPTLLEIWPRAKFIFCKRRVLEVIASRRRKFPNDTLENHYLDWADVMSAWLAVRHQVGYSAIEVEQHQMAHCPAEVADAVGFHLGLSELSRRALVQELTSDHPEQTADEVGSVVPLALQG